MSTIRAARVMTPEFEVRLGSEFGRLIDISATGALVRTRTSFRVGREYPMLVNSTRGPVSLAARVVRTQPMADAELEDHGEHASQQFIGVQFTQLPASAKAMVRELCGPGFSRTE